jgi:hypothetical protein
MPQPSDLRDRIDRLRAERAALRVEAAALQRMADERADKALGLTVEILELQTLLARREGRDGPFP